jgi:HK97 family phage prohead protease
MSEKEVITREAVGTIEGTGDGRTLDLRVVPWNTPARVTDNRRDYYTEVWLPGCFDRQVKAPNRVRVKDKIADNDVLMNFEHERGIGGVIGHGVELRNEESGFEGTFRMLAAADADKALELVNEGILTGVSLEAEPIETVREDGVVKRVKARLVNIALCRSPAFQEAQVLAVREGEPEAEEVPPIVVLPPPPEGIVPPEMGGLPAPVERSDVDALLERLGYEPLVVRAVTRKPWSGAASKYPDTNAYCKASLIDDNPPGEEKTQARCHLPVYEPNGDLNANALGAAAARLNQTQSPQKAAAARKLVRLYRQAGMDPPASLLAAAAR